MLNLFTWLRRRVSQAILDGTQDALEALDGVNGSATPSPLRLPDALQARLLAALPLPAEPDAAPHVPDEDAPSANGRRKRA